jgi:hypothetical protein
MKAAIDILYSIIPECCQSSDSQGRVTKSTSKCIRPCPALLSVDPTKTELSIAAVNRGTVVHVMQINFDSEIFNFGEYTGRNAQYRTASTRPLAHTLGPGTSQFA